MTFTVDQNMIMIAIFISVIGDVFFKPFINMFISSAIRAGLSRIAIFTISYIAMRLIGGGDVLMDSITTSVLSMLFYDVAGYSLLKKIVNKKLKSSDIRVK